MLRIVLNILGVFVFANIVFLLMLVFGYVFNKTYDLPALYIITIATTAVLFLWVSYESHLLNKAQSAFNRKDYKTAFAITEKLAKKDHRQAQYNLSLMYRDGIGTRKSEKGFWHWLEKSAISNSDAQILYAQTYFKENPYGKETLEVVRRYLRKFVQDKKHPYHAEGLEQLERIETLLEIERKR